MAHQAGAYPCFCSRKRLGIFFPLDGMRCLSIEGVTPSIKFAGTHLYTWVERGTVRLKCLAQEHNKMSAARAQTWTARAGDERTNHEATGPATIFFLEDHSCRRASLSENCSLLGTNNFRGPISEHVLAPNNITS